jgi:hypothetical protein
MVDCRGLDISRADIGHEQQKREAVGTARHREPEPSPGRDERVEIAPEALGLSGQCRHALCNRHAFASFEQRR